MPVVGGRPRVPAGRSDPGHLSAWGSLATLPSLMSATLCGADARVEPEAPRAVGESNLLQPPGWGAKLHGVLAKPRGQGQATGGFARRAMCQLSCFFGHVELTPPMLTLAHQTGPDAGPWTPLWRIWLDTLKNLKNTLWTRPSAGLACVTLGPPPARHRGLQGVSTRAPSRVGLNCRQLELAGPQVLGHGKVTGCWVCGVCGHFRDRRFLGLGSVSWRPGWLSFLPA